MAWWTDRRPPGCCHGVLAIRLGSHDQTRNQRILLFGPERREQECWYASLRAPLAFARREPGSNSISGSSPALAAASLLEMRPQHLTQLILRFGLQEALFSASLYRSTNFLSVQACESSVSEAARQRSTNSRRCSGDANARSRASFSKGRRGSWCRSRCGLPRYGSIWAQPADQPRQAR